MHRLSLFAFLALPAAVAAQAPQDRFELGRRLRLLERAVEKTTDAKARRRAAAQLEKVTAAFFTGQTGKAAEMLDLARHALADDKKPSDAVRFADSLRFRVAPRLTDATTPEVPVTVQPFYAAGERPEKVELRLALLRHGGKEAATRTVTLGAFPSFLTALKVKDLTEGDHALRIEVMAGGKTLATAEQTISVVKKLDDRMAALRKGLADLKGKDTTEAATLARLVGVLKDLSDKKSLETDYPAARLLAEAEAVLAAARAGKPYYTKDRPGQFWLTLVSGKSQDPVRVQVPPAAMKGQPLPVVVAMHGAGGSENMFFDAYGDGLVAKLAAERGWVVVATRSGVLSSADPARVVDALAKIYPVDKKKVVLVGHSMGASQAVSAAGRAPERFAAVAALGGGGRVSSAKGLVAVPFFVGVGDKDFAVPGAKALDAALRKAGVKKVTYKTYEGIEHLLIVQLALRDVYRFFDAALEGE